MEDDDYTGELLEAVERGCRSLEPNSNPSATSTIESHICRMSKVNWPDTGFSNLPSVQHFKGKLSRQIIAMESALFLWCRIPNVSLRLLIT